MALLLPPVDLPTPPSTVEQAVEAVKKEAFGVLTAARGISYDAVVGAAADNIQYFTAQLAILTSHVTGLWYAYAVIIFCVYWKLSANPPVYILDFAVYEAPKEWQVSGALRGAKAPIFRCLVGASRLPPSLPHRFHVLTSSRSCAATAA